MVVSSMLDAAGCLGRQTVRTPPLPRLELRQAVVVGAVRWTREVSRARMV